MSCNWRGIEKILSLSTRAKKKKKKRSNRRKNPLKKNLRKKKRLKKKNQRKTLRKILKVMKKSEMREKQPEKLKLKDWRSKLKRMKMKRRRKSKSTTMRSMMRKRRRKQLTLMKSTRSWGKNTHFCGKKEKRWPLKNADGNGSSKNASPKTWLSWSRNFHVRKRRKSVSAKSTNRMRRKMVMTTTSPSTSPRSRPVTISILTTRSSLMSRTSLSFWSKNASKENSIWTSTFKSWTKLLIRWSKTQTISKRFNSKSTCWPYWPALWSRLPKPQVFCREKTGCKPINVSTSC